VDSGGRNGRGVCIGFMIRLICLTRELFQVLNGNNAAVKWHIDFRFLFIIEVTELRFYFTCSASYKFFTEIWIALKVE
jgi:hypothetical protein